MQTIESYIGVSTNCLPKVDIWEAIKLVRGAGFLSLEIHLGDFEGAIGAPWLIPHAGVWPRTFGSKEREKLKDELSCFDTVVVHGTPIDINISAINPGIREESQRQYLEALHFAIDIGCKYMTYHPGRQSNSIQNPVEVRQHNIEFIEKVIDEAEANGIYVAYESFDLKYLEAIKSHNFGILLDMGHLVMGNPRGDTNTVIEWIGKLGNRLIEVHAHDVMNWSEVPIHGIAHRSFSYGTCIDLGKVSRKLCEVDYFRPMIFEIVEPTVEKTLEECLKAKKIICKNYE